MGGFTSKRTLKEGMVGLLILLGAGAFGGIFLWLNGINPGSNSYKAMVEFANAGGMQKGAPVRYRGVKVGSISKITTGANAIEVELEINDPNLKIPANSTIEASQSGLISESIIDILPPSDAEISQDVPGALDKDCNPGLIICNGATGLKGQIGVSVDELIRESYRFAAQYNNKEFYGNVNRLLVTSADAASSVANLTKEIQTISKSFQNQIGTFSDTATTLQRSTNELTATTTKTASQFSATASDFSVTAKQASKLLDNLDELLITNRSTLVSTLNSISQTSNQLRQTVSSLSPAINRFTDGELLKNLELLSANAAEASANLKNASDNLNNPKNIVLLQQTLDAARGTFENTQKITADLDELTGDPKFRQNLLQLVNGLSKLVSSTQDMQEQAKVAMTLDSLKNSVNQQEAIISNSQLLNLKQEQIEAKINQTTQSQKQPQIQPQIQTETKIIKSRTIIPQPTVFTTNPDVKETDQLKQVVISTPPTTSELLTPMEMTTPSTPEQLIQKLREHKGTVDSEQ